MSLYFTHQLFELLLYCGFNGFWLKRWTNSTLTPNSFQLKTFNSCLPLNKIQRLFSQRVQRRTRWNDCYDYNNWRGKEEEWPHKCQVKSRWMTGMNEHCVQTFHHKNSDYDWISINIRRKRKHKPWPMTPILSFLQNKLLS